MTGLGKHLHRRTLLRAGAVGAGAAAGAAGSRSVAAPPLVSRRLQLPYGVQTGDVTSREAVVWARSSGPGRLLAELRTGRRSQRIRGPWATAATDGTAKLPLDGLDPGREYAVRLSFEDERGRVGEVQTATFRTASVRSGATSFVWTGDNCGQGWGINPDLGGLVGYRTMLDTRPEFFLHSGDCIYGDGEIAERVTEPDGQVWRNVVAEGVEKVAESLDEFRGRYRYTRLDDHFRALTADVPVVAQWDDHETHNNWWPGQILTDERYVEKRVDVLALRARRAWQEYQPIADPRAHRRGDGFAPARIYRKVERGRHLDVFCLDMRTFKDPNTPGLETEPTHILGTEQTEWLIREVRRSRATWKVIAADLPLGLVVPDGAVNQESLANRDHGAPLGKELEIAAVLSAFKAAGVRNVVWLTADVHYCAAHHYDPARAGFTDFDPFWEFVAGPVAAGTFGPNQLDGTFGPVVDFQKAGARSNESPRVGNQFFGHVDIDDAGLMTVSLRDIGGQVLYTRELQPA
ncbi:MULTISPECIES: alkaline phosphatase D family protein [unclassified Nocardioides]|uniref:alkaline phosphatase D family protein n=1 Tax=unclassified Nocardioides TaxID=2615069 RepID=UPI003605ADAC